MAFKLRNVAMALRIIIVLNVFINTGVFTFYKPPEREDFCADFFRIQTEDECIAEGGEWISGRGFVETRGEAIAQPLAEGRCLESKECRDEYRQARGVYNRNVFVVLLIAGLLSLFAGFLLNADAVSTGLSFGGILSIFIGTVRYWSDMDEILRFVLSGIALIILIWVGYKKFKR